MNFNLELCHPRYPLAVHNLPETFEAEMKADLLVGGRGMVTLSHPTTSTDMQCTAQALGRQVPGNSLGTLHSNPKYALSLGVVQQTHVGAGDRKENSRWHKFVLRM